MSLLAISALVAVPAIGQFAAGLLNRLASLLHARGSFRSDALSEASKFAIIRILFGLFMLERSIWVIVYMFPSDWDSPLLVLTIFVSLGASAMVFFGLFTQVALAYLILIQWQIGKSGCFFTNYEEMLGKFVQYYFAASGGPGGRFLYAQYFQALPDVEQIVAGSYVPNEVQQICSREFRLE